MLLALIGEQFNEADEIRGVVVSIRPCQDKISLSNLDSVCMATWFLMLPAIVMIEHLMKHYPNAIEFLIHSANDKQPWRKLTPHFIELLKDEKRIHKQEEPFVIEKVRKLLMLAKNFKIPIKKLLAAANYFDFLGDFPIIVIPKYPQYVFVLDPQRSYRPLELVEWDESLAITKLEKKAKSMALEKSLGEIETKGKPLPFKLKYSARM
ncbi:hypothetical protein L7F22_034259 [Adiantum nelumboides]|nr:hypothetical protein [Adiantum nelumboides]